MSSISEQPLTSRLRALALQAGPDQNWIRQTMEDAIRVITEQKELLDGDDEQLVELEAKIADLEEINRDLCAELDDAQKAYERAVR